MRPNKQYYVDKKLNNSQTGEFSHLPGSKYKGQWSQNKKEGFGTETDTNGNVYEGEFLNNVKEGKGTYYTSSSSSRGPSSDSSSSSSSSNSSSSSSSSSLRKSYTGDWSGGHPSGHGVHTSSTGARYTGHWSLGLRSGPGQQLYADGRVYEGEWKDGRKDGRGVLRMPNGDVHVGTFRNDMKDGPGRYMYRNTKKVYEGEWTDDTARCGEFRQMNETEMKEIYAAGASTTTTSSSVFVLPQLTLSDSVGVLAASVVDVRQARALLSEEKSGDKYHSSSQQSAARVRFTDEDYEQVRLAFGAYADATTGTVQVSMLEELLLSLGIQMQDGALEGLLDRLGAAEQDDDVTYAEFVDIVVIVSGGDA